MRKLLSLLTAILFVGTMWGGAAQHFKETVTLSDGSHDGSKITWTAGNDKLTIQQLQGTSGTAVNASYISAPRVYKGHILSFSAASGYTIDTVIITCNGTNYGNSMTAGTVLDGNTVTNSTTNIDRRLYASSGCKDTLINKVGASTFYLQNVASGSNVQLRFTALDIRYTKAATYDPEITVGNVAFGTFVPGISSTKALTVIGENVSETITATLKSGSNFSISGSLTAEGGELTVSVTNTSDGDYSDSIRFSVGGVVMARSYVSAHVVNTTGKGTSENPFTVEDVVKLNNGLGGNFWVKGYILRGFTGSQIDDSSQNGLLLADKMASPEDTVSVQLPNSSDIRTALNVKDNKSKGWLVKIQGSLEAYGGFKGVKSPTDYAIIPEPRVIVKNNASETIDAMAFGNVGQRWQQSFVFGFSYENLEAGDLTMTIGGTNASAFAFSGGELTETVNIASAGNGTVSMLSFHQATQVAGDYEATLTFTGCGLTSPVVVPITMTVKVPEFTYTPATIAFGDVKQHLKATETFTLTGRYLKKNGWKNVKMISTSGIFDPLGEDEEYFISSDENGEINETVTVTCDATDASAGAKAGTLTLKSMELVSEFADKEEVVSFSATIVATYGIQIVSENGYVSVNSSAPTTDTTVYVVDENEGITLVATPAVGYEFVNWTYDDNKVILSTDDDVTTTTAYAYEAATITANFQAMSCTPLAAPTLNKVTKTYNSATIAWNAVANASAGYAVYVYNDSEKTSTKASDLVTEGTSFAVNTLNANTTYYYTIMAMGDGNTYCDENNSLLEGSFTTEDYPAATLTLSENGASRVWGADTLKIASVIALPTSASKGVDDKVLVGYDLNSTCSVVPAYAPGANFTMTSTSQTLYAVYATQTGGDYVKVTNVSQLADGDKVVITGGTTAGMKAYSSGDNNCKVAAIVITNDTITTLGEACELTLRDSADAWMFYDGAYYIYAAGTSTSGKNYMKGKAVSDAACLWTITISDGSTTIQSNENDKTPYMRYNSGNSLFSCYYSSTGQNGVTLYRKTALVYSNYGTTGAYTPTGFDNLESDVKAVKVLRDGQIYILRGEKVYTIQGQLVK